MKEQIEEIARVLNETCNRYDENGNHLGNKCSQCEDWDDTNHLCCSYNTKEAEALYNAGYRKQSEGEWLMPASSEPWKGNSFGLCSRCGKVDNGFIKKAHKYCPNCGAHMKGGVE